MEEDRISFVVATNSDDVLRKNLLASPVLRNGHQLILKRNYSSISLAYNAGISEAEHDIMVFIHQDVFLPEKWDDKLLFTIKDMESRNVRWGVLGVYGVTGENNDAGYVYSNGLQRLLGKSGQSEEVRTLDEVVLVLRKSSGLMFDVLLPHFHLYGTDICLEAKEKNLKNFAINNYCIHNSLPIVALDNDFWECTEYIRRKWRKDLPIRTPVVTIYRNPFRRFIIKVRKRIGHLRLRKRNLLIKRNENLSMVEHG